MNKTTVVNYVPKVMLLRDMGYDILLLKDIRHLLGKKINKIKNRHVYIYEDTVYKIIDEGISDHFWYALKSGFFKRAAPTLRGLIVHQEEFVGYYMDKCRTLHMNKREHETILITLKELFLQTGLVFADYHSLNFGQTTKGITILDLESVVPPTRTQNADYNNFVTEWSPIE